MQIYAAKALGNIVKNNKSATKALIKKLTKNWVIKINKELEYDIVISLGKIGGTTNINILNPFLKKYLKYIKNKKYHKISYYYNDSIKRIAKNNP
jgi:hypothetical protein